MVQIGANILAYVSERGFTISGYEMITQMNLRYIPYVCGLRLHVTVKLCCEPIKRYDYLLINVLWFEKKNNCISKNSVYGNVA